MLLRIYDHFHLAHPVYVATPCPPDAVLGLGAEGAKAGLDTSGARDMNGSTTGFPHYKPKDVKKALGTFAFEKNITDQGLQPP